MVRNAGQCYADFRFVRFKFDGFCAGVLLNYVHGIIFLGLPGQRRCRQMSNLQAALEPIIIQGYLYQTKWYQEMNDYFLRLWLSRSGLVLRILREMLHEFGLGRGLWRNENSRPCTYAYARQLHLRACPMHAPSLIDTSIAIQTSDYDGVCYIFMRPRELFAQ